MFLCQLYVGSLWGCYVCSRFRVGSALLHFSLHILLSCIYSLIASFSPFFLWLYFQGMGVRPVDGPGCVQECIQSLGSKSVFEEFVFRYCFWHCSIQLSCLKWLHIGVMDLLWLYTCIIFFF